MNIIIKQHFNNLREEIETIIELYHKLENARRKVKETADLVFSDGVLKKLDSPTKIFNSFGSSMDLGFSQAELENNLESFERALSNLVYAKEVENE